MGKELIQYELCICKVLWSPGSGRWRLWLVASDKTWKRNKVFRATLDPFEGCCHCHSPGARWFQVEKEGTDWVCFCDGECTLLSTKEVVQWERNMGDKVQKHHGDHQPLQVIAQPGLCKRETENFWTREFLVICCHLFYKKISFGNKPKTNWREERVKSENAAGKERDLKSEMLESEPVEHEALLWFEEWRSECWGGSINIHILLMRKQSEVKCLTSIHTTNK